MVQINSEPFILYFPIRACSSMGREEGSSTTFWSQLQPGISCREDNDNESGEPAGRLEADCKPGRTSCCRTKGSLAAWCLSWCCDNSFENTDLTAFMISKDGNWLHSDWSPPQKEEKATSNQHQTVTNTTHTFMFSSFLFTLPASRVQFNQYAKMHPQKLLSYCVSMSASSSKMNIVVSLMIPKCICMQR